LGPKFSVFGVSYPNTQVVFDFLDAGSDSDVGGLIFDLINIAEFVAVASTYKIG